MVVQLRQLRDFDTHDHPAAWTSSDHRISGSSDHWTTESSGWGPSKSLNQSSGRIIEPADHQIIRLLGLMGSSIGSRPADQRISGPADQQTTGRWLEQLPIWEDCHQPHGEAVGHEYSNDSTSSTQRQQPARVAQLGCSLLRSHWGCSRPATDQALGAAAAVVP